MLVTTEVVALQNALNKVLAIIDKRNSRPILTQILFKAQNNKIEIIATDLEVSAKIIIDANVENEGIFCVNSKNIHDIIRELPKYNVTLSLKDSTLDIQCNEVFYSLVVSNSDEYPTLAFPENENAIKMPAATLVDIINRTSFAVSTDETRLFLNGIFLQEIDSKLRAVATDGHRLAMYETSVGELNNQFLINGIIVPSKGIFELKRISETFFDQEINIHIDESFIFAFVKDKYYLSIRLIARDYPKYQEVIPNKTSFSMIVDRDLFLDAVKRIKIMSSEKSHGVRIHLKKNIMTIMANHPSLGHAIENVPIEYDDEEFEIGFNAKYLIDTFSCLDSGEIILEFNNVYKPVIIRSTSLPDFLGIIMPLKL